MQPCYEPATELADATEASTGDGETLRERLKLLRESVDSEWIAFGEAFSAPGRPLRKWLGWALYRVATRVNPEIADSDR